MYYTTQFIDNMITELITLCHNGLEGSELQIFIATLKIYEILIIFLIVNAAVIVITITQTKSTGV